MDKIFRIPERAPLENLCNRFGIHHATFAVCVCQLGTTLLHTTFMFYYVKVFMTRYHVNDAWFDYAQVLFLVWNAVNDPLFGYLQNMSSSWMRSRKKVILYGSGLFAASFLIPWFPWTTDEGSAWIIGMHLVVSLYVYDGLFSFVVLAWCALFSEISTEHSSRVRAMKYMQVMVLIGVNVLFVMDKISRSLTEFHLFQFASVVIAILAFGCFWYTGKYSPDRVAQCDSFGHLVPLMTTKVSDSIDAGHDDHKMTNTIQDGYVNTESPYSLLTSANSAVIGHKEDGSMSNSDFVRHSWRITKQILHCRDFHRFVWMNFLHVCRSTAHLNFAAIFTERLIPASILPLGSWRMSCFYGICAVVPQVIIICGSRLVLRFGSYQLMMYSFYASVVSGLAMLLVGVESSYLVMGFMLLDSILVHTFAPLTNILCADLIDEDMINNRRSTPVSSVIFGLNALITKPAISVAPMVIVYVLDKFNYELYKKNLLTDEAALDDLTSAMFFLLCLMAVIPGVLQWLVFRNYSLRSKHLTQAQLPR